MRLQLIGSYSLDEFEEAVSLILKDLRTSEIDALKHVNIYTQFLAKGRTVEFVEEGSDVEHLVYDFGRGRKVSLSPKSLLKGSPIRGSQIPDEEE